MSVETLPTLVPRRMKLAAGVLTMGVYFTLSVPAHAQKAPSRVIDSPPAVVAVSASAPAASSPRTIAGSGPGPCVQVDIAGHRAGHLECASQRLEQAARVARKEAQAGRDIVIPQAGSSDVQVGVASRSATRLRLRENFGVSIRPPAVGAPVFTPPTGPRR